MNLIKAIRMVLSPRYNSAQDHFYRERWKDGRKYWMSEAGGDWHEYSPMMYREALRKAEIVIKIKKKY